MDPLPHRSRGSRYSRSRSTRGLLGLVARMCFKDDRKGVHGLRHALHVVSIVRIGQALVDDPLLLPGLTLFPHRPYSDERDMQLVELQQLMEERLLEIGAVAGLLRKDDGAPVAEPHE